MTLHVKPKDGLKIKRPDNGKILAKAGEEVPANTFWRRRLADGDVIECEKPAAKPAAKKEESKANKDQNGGKQ